MRFSSLESQFKVSRDGSKELNRFRYRKDLKDVYELPALNNFKPIITNLTLEGSAQKLLSKPTPKPQSSLINSQLILKSLALKSPPKKKKIKNNLKLNDEDFDHSISMLSKGLFDLNEQVQGSRSESEELKETPDDSPSSESETEKDEMDQPEVGDCSSCRSHDGTEGNKNGKYSRSVTIVTKPNLKRRHGYRHRHRNKKKSISVRPVLRVSSRTPLEQSIMRQEDDFVSYQMQKMVRMRERLNSQRSRQEQSARRSSEEKLLSPARRRTRKSQKVKS